MLVRKTIKAGVIGLTNFKKEVLDFEYLGFQWFMIFGQDKGIYSSYKAAKGWKNKIIKYKEYPLPLWQQLTQIEQNSNKLSKYWIKIRTKKKRGGIWVAFKPHCELPDAKLCDSFLIFRKGKYELRLVYEWEQEIKKSYSNILAVDLGEKHIATSVKFNDVFSSPKFYGKEVRGIRRHYAWLRKRLGERKLFKKLKQLGEKEKRKIRNVLHEISNKIVKEATTNNCVIVLGKLKGIRNQKRGRRLNRIISNMPYYKLTQYITYKANWNGIEVVKVNERNTSVFCHKCGNKGKRFRQGAFFCNICNIEYNADLNGAKNILKRSLGYKLNDGAMAYAQNLPA